MIMRREVLGDEGLQELIPATFDFETQTLKLENNGVSEVFFGALPEEIETHDVNGFQLFGIANAPIQRPFFVAYGGDKPLDKEITDDDIMDSPLITTWELFYVKSKRRKDADGNIIKKSIKYSVLRRCKKDTLFCKCDDCGEHFIITPQTAKFYQERGLQIPTIRCPKCIQRKRIKYAVFN